MELFKSKKEGIWGDQSKHTNDQINDFIARLEKNKKCYFSVIGSRDAMIAIKAIASYCAKNGAVTLNMGFKEEKGLTVIEGVAEIND